MAGHRGRWLTEMHPMATGLLLYSGLLPLVQSSAATTVPVLNVLNGSYFVAARKAAAAQPSAELRQAISAINGSAWIHIPESHVHDSPRTRNETTQCIGPFSVMNKSFAAPSGDKHDFICISSYYWPCSARCGVDAPAPKGASCATFCKPPHTLQPNGSCLYEAVPSRPGPLPHGCPATGHTAKTASSWCNNGSNIVSRDGKATIGDCSCSACNMTSGMPWASHNGFNWPGAEVDRGSIDGVWENVIPLVLGWWCE